MKNILIFFFLFCGMSFTNAQSACIDLPYTNVLYRGVKNQVVVNVSGYPNHEAFIEVENGRIEKVSSGVYTLYPGAEKVCTITAGAKNANSRVVLKKADYRVSDIPAPTLYLSKQISGSEVSREGAIFEVRMSFHVPIHTSFTVSEWEASCGERKISGKTDDLQKLQEFIENSEIGNQLIITGKSVGGDEKERSFGGVWILKE
ncbi:MAG: hypothetical protein ACFHU9_01690 [Fluviicola sp.]